MSPERESVKELSTARGNSTAEQQQLTQEEPRLLEIGTRGSPFQWYLRTSRHFRVTSYKPPEKHPHDFVEAIVRIPGHVNKRSGKL